MPDCGQLAQIRTDQQTIRYMLQWHITNKCNLRCEHCYQETYHGQGLPLPDLLGILQQFKDFILEQRKRGDEVARGYVTVTGGEPFARRDILKLLGELAAEKELLSFSVLTNGTIMSPELAREVARLAPGYVQVSVEGGQATHDKIRGEGTFNKTASCLQILREAGVRTMVSFTAHRSNYKEFPEVVGMACDLGVSRVWADRLIPEGSGADIASKMLSPQETLEFFEIMAEARKQSLQSAGCRTEVAMHRALQFLLSQSQPYHCTAGDTLFTVMPNGDLCPCRRMPITAGNLLVTPLNTLYNCDLFKSLRAPGKSISGCESCQHAGACRGGLKCLSFAITGDAFRVDPGCWMSDQTISKTA
jgi:radical SAM protein with 4Fe4S-binding SPASM domain